MAALREMGLTAALLVATGGAALATWNYFSARRKAAGRDTEPEHGVEESADTAIALQGEADTALRVGGDGASCGDRAAIPAQQLGEDRVGSSTNSRHEAEDPAVSAAALTQHSHYSNEEDQGASPSPAPGKPPVIKEVSTSHSSSPTPPQVKTSPCKQVLVLGLDGSGKTSVLNSMASNKGNIVTTPTGGVNAMCLIDGNSKMEFLEIGGSEQLRPYWKMYLSKAFAIIFVVDASDHGRLPLAKRHLHQLIQQDAVLPLIVLANKQDLENAYHIAEIHDALALSEICENRKLFLIGTHVTNGDSEISTGIQDAKEYLVQLFSEHDV